ncbi:MAG: succinylglutamate desuccinylase/aspartoacylase family protein [Betaproteobacteria bacterium]|nr:succinylglutamate desuccinylase/aspartoacylase family protein [Betaproteobacteria bacterium]
MPVSKNKIKLPAMTPGTTRSIAWLRYGKAGARPKVYLQAAIHANELPGAMLLHHLMPLLGEADRAGRIRGEIIVVPTVNPIGQSQLVGNTHVGGTTCSAATTSTGTGWTFPVRSPNGSAPDWGGMRRPTSA